MLIEKNDIKRLISCTIKQLRIKNNMSQSEFSTKLNRSKSFTNEIENGRGNITIDTFYNVCQALSIKPREFLEIVEDELGIDLPKINPTENYADMELAAQLTKSNKNEAIIADEIFVSASFLQSIRYSRTKPSLSNLILICIAIEIQPSSLFLD